MAPDRLLSVCLLYALLNTEGGDINTPALEQAGLVFHSSLFPHIEHHRINDGYHELTSLTSI